MKLSNKARNAVNKVIFSLAQRRHATIPLAEVREALAKWGAVIDDCILCGRNGSANIEILIGGESVRNTMLCIQWCKGEHDGQFEFNGYLS